MSKIIDLTGQKFGRLTVQLYEIAYNQDVCKEMQRILHDNSVPSFDSSEKV